MNMPLILLELNCGGFSQKKKLNCGEATETHGRHNQFFINANTYFMVEKIDVGASQIVIS
jgi:hypothetical protein